MGKRILRGAEGAINERRAMEEMLKRLNLKSLSYGKLGYIREVFGIKINPRREKMII